MHKLKKGSGISGAEGCQAVAADPVPPMERRMHMTSSWTGVKNINEKEGAP
jgi:hypothetical protein